jgi:hypothetical protein
VAGEWRARRDGYDRKRVAGYLEIIMAILFCESIQAPVLSSGLVPCLACLM